MCRRIFGIHTRPILMVAMLALSLPLVSSAGSAQGKKIQTKAPKHTEDVSGKLTVKTSPEPGVGEVVLENYTGSPLKGIQFRLLSTSLSQIESVLPGSPVSDKETYIFSYNIVPGNSKKSGPKTDTISIVIFANARAVIPSGASVQLVNVHYRRPPGTGSSARTVSFKILDILAGLPNATAASIGAGSKVSLNLWK